MLRLVRYVAAEVSSDNYMPSRVVFLVKLLLDECCDVLLNVVFLESLTRTVYGVLLPERRRKDEGGVWRRREKSERARLKERMSDAKAIFICRVIFSHGIQFTIKNCTRAL
jgi:hypothetical protein